MGSKTAMADGSAAASDAVSKAGCDSETTIGTMQRVSARDSPKLDAMELEQDVPCRSSASSRQGLRSKTWIGRAKWGWRGKVSGRPGRLKTLVLVVVFPGKVGGSSIAGDEDGDGGMGGDKKTDWMQHTSATTRCVRTACQDGPGWWRCSLGAPISASLWRR